MGPQVCWSGCLLMCTVPSVCIIFSHFHLSVNCLSCLHFLYFHLEYSNKLDLVSGDCGRKILHRPLQERMSCSLFATSSGIIPHRYQALTVLHHVGALAAPEPSGVAQDAAGTAGTSRRLSADGTATTSDHSTRSLQQTVTEASELKVPTDCDAWNDVDSETGVCKYTECCVDPGVSYCWPSAAAATANNIVRLLVNGCGAEDSSIPRPSARSVVGPRIDNTEP